MLADINSAKKIVSKLADRKGFGTARSENSRIIKMNTGEMVFDEFH